MIPNPDADRKSNWGRHYAAPYSMINHRERISKTRRIFVLEMHHAFLRGLITGTEYERLTGWPQ